MDQQTLDCQQCGNVVVKLTLREAQQVAHNPLNYIVYCRACRQATA